MGNSIKTLSVLIYAVLLTVPPACIPGKSIDDGNDGGSDADTDADSGEDSNTSYVYGQIYSNVDIGYIFDGDLDEESAKYYGYCKKDEEGNFEFVVGSDDLNNIGGDNAFYLSVRGIDGPPVKGVYETETFNIKEDENLWREFDEALYAGKNKWSFNAGDSEIPEECKVRLYASASIGEKVSMDGSTKNETFEYFIHFLCPRLDKEPDTVGPAMRNIDAMLWFDNCR